MKAQRKFDSHQFCFSYPGTDPDLLHVCAPLLCVYFDPDYSYSRCIARVIDNHSSGYHSLVLRLFFFSYRVGVKKRNGYLGIAVQHCVRVLSLYLG